MRKELYTMEEKKRKLNHHEGCLRMNNDDNNSCKLSNEKYTPTSTAFRLARRWSKRKSSITVKKMRKLISCIEVISKNSEENDSMTGKLAKYLGKAFLLSLLNRNGNFDKQCNSKKVNANNVEKELQNMLARKELWEIEDEIFVSNYHSFIENFENQLRTKELKVESALIYSLKNNVVLNENSLVLEFGVASGASIRDIANNVPSDQIVYGFDSFQGLPKFWRTGFGIGKFSMPDGEAPIFGQHKNIKVIKGLFEDTCDDFFKLQSEQNKTISLLHIDCDIYASTRTIFTTIGKYLKNSNLIVNGTIIVFDELVCYNGFEKHELLAFYEFLQQHPALSYEIIGTKHIGCMSVGIKILCAGAEVQ